MDAIRVTQVSATLMRLGQRLSGTLHLTRYHMIFRAAAREVWLCYPIISEVVRRPGSNAIRIVCKDFMFLSFEFGSPSDANAVFDSLEELVRIRSIDQLYAFVYAPASVEKQYNGWDLYDPLKEYQRMNIDWCQWRVTAANEKFALCPTYPRVLVVPASISDSVLTHAAKFRSKSRLPVLSYHHSLNKSTITRCSQPLIGIKQNRSMQDESLIMSIFATTQSPEGLCGAHNDNLLMDLRPSTNALAQIALGGGTENLERYRPTRKIYSSIDNLHVMRDSLAKVTDSLRHSDVSDSAPNPTSLDKSQWLKHVGRILDATRIVVEQVHFKCSHVVVHCSDGWDRTPQITSLAMLCLDPYYRTLEGFMVLVEKEWVSFGHQFARRNREETSSPLSPPDGSGDYPGDSVDLSSAANSVFTNVTNFISETTKGKQIGPIFQQFLDCAYQLVYFYPGSFEFNERFLRRLLYHSYACQYGTFLFDNQREALAANVSTRTRSVWDYFLARRAQFVNPSYNQPDKSPESDLTDVLLPSPQLAPRWWSGSFGRADEDMNDREAWRKPSKLPSTTKEVRSSPAETEELSSSAHSNPSDLAGEESTSPSSSSEASETGTPEHSMTLTASVVNALRKVSLGPETEDKTSNETPAPAVETRLLDSPVS